MTNEQLAEFIQQGGNDELLPLLWDKTRVLIYKKCGEIWRCYSAKLELFGYSLDDLRQEGYNALIFAVQQFKSEREYKFTSYLNYALKHVIRTLLNGGADVLNQTGTMSLEQPLGESDSGDPLLVADIIPDENAAAVYGEIERSDKLKALHIAVECLPDELRVIIRERYFEQLTFFQIGKRHGYSYDRARLLHGKALGELRRNRALKAAYYG